MIGTANGGRSSAANRAEKFVEQKVPAELCDSCVLAQKEGALVLTEDFLYLQANEALTGKKAPEYCSVFALIRVLLDEGKITFEKYLAFFSYLTSYRFRFLPISVEDIERAVYGEGVLKIIKPENIRAFNFSVTLSVDYGVPFKIAFRLVAGFLMRVILDPSVLPETAERIFLEVISSFPTDQDKRSVASMLVLVCAREIEKNHGRIIAGTHIENKLDRLLRIAALYTGPTLWTPSS